MQSALSTTSKRSIFSTAVLIIGILLIAANLRSPITGVGVVLEQIIENLQLSASQAGMLNTLPLLAFALAAPLAANFAKKHGLEISLFLALMLIGIGILSRTINSVTIFYVGTAIIGIGIAIGNVLLPSLIKRDFPHQVAILTSAYVLSMGISSGIYSAVLIPLSSFRNTGWNLALASYGLITLISILIWLPQLKSRSKPTKDILTSAKKGRIWHHALAWHITLQLGLNSFFSYMMIAWLPSILISGGLDAQQAGVLHGVFLIATALPGIVLIPLLAKLSDQRMLSLTMGLLVTLSCIGLMYASSYSFAWTAILGFCSGGVFILGLSFISLRTNHSSQAASLSGMAQFVGYLLAATGPIIAGWLHNYFDSWPPVLWLCALASFLSGVFGYLGGRNITLDKDA